MFIKVKVPLVSSEVIFKEVTHTIDLKAEMTSRTQIQLRSSRNHGS